MMTCTMVIEQTRSRIFLQIMQICGSALLIALCAQIRIPIPFSPVPLTLQTLAVLMIGSSLGSRQGAFSVILYLTAALIGLPVLSGGRSDMLALLSPVGGYLLGFVIQAYIAGWFYERFNGNNQVSLFCGLLLACAVQLVFGALWLGFFIGFQNAAFAGIVPFIPGEILKVIAVSSVLNFKKA